MNKLKALLIAGLLSLTSVSFATSVTKYVGPGTQQAGATVGAVNLLADGVAGQLSGDFFQDGDAATTTSSVFYDINMNAYDNHTFGYAQIQYDLDVSGPIDLQFYEVTGGGLVAFGAMFNTNFNLILDSSKNYMLKLTGLEGFGYSGKISAVPVPAAGILFASALLGAGAFGRRKKKAQASVVGAFARES